LPGIQKAGPVVTDEINVPLPGQDSQGMDVTLDFGAGDLTLIPGSTALVSGTAKYNVSDFKPEITVTESTALIKQGNWKMNSIPDFTNIKNEWDLALGNFPIDLEINAGAYHAEYELGGLALTSLSIKDGASNVKLNFASPNLAEMSLLSYDTGASSVTLTGLGNANFTSLVFNAGAGNYTLDFSGQLNRSGSVHIVTGVSNLTLVIPAGLPVQLTMEGGLSNITHPSGWSVNGNVYTQAGSGPQLTIVVEIGAGNLILTR
jgi:hypothetical protein